MGANQETPFNLPSTRRPSLASPTDQSLRVPVPRYVMTKAYLHRDKVEMFNDSIVSPSTSSAPSVQQPLQPLQKTSRQSSRKRQADSLVEGLSAPPPPTNSQARPKKALPKVTPAVQAHVALTSAPNTLPSLPVPPAPTFAILAPDTEVVLPPPKKRVKARSQDAIQRRRATQHAKRDAQVRFRGFKDIWIKHLAKTKVLILTNFDIADVPCGTGGWRGSSKRTYHAPRTVEEAIQEGFRQLEWDGLETIAILDCQRRLIILLRKRDVSKAGLERQERMTETLRKASERAKLSAKTAGKGDFYALREGIVHATGTPVRCIFFKF